MVPVIDHIKKNILLYILFVVFSYLFFYRLDYTTLGSWDEAWYGSIAREMVRTGDIFHMSWNGAPYYDHPPMGFWLMALAYKLFGINEFTTRLPSAALGVLSIFFIYRIGEALFKKKEIGFAAALVLGTSVWYVLRVRSGNLDSTFVFFYILTVYLSIRSSQNVRWFPAAMLSFGALFLTKTLVGASAAVLIFFLNFHHLTNLKKTFHYLLLGLLSFGLFVLPWYTVNIREYDNFIQHHFFNIGTRNKDLGSYLKLSITEPLFYLHMGVRKWYYVWILATGFIFISLKFLRKYFLLLIIWNFIVLYPFLTSEKTELWHLIPVYVPLALIVASGIFELSSWGVTTAKKLSPIKAVTNKIFTPFFVKSIFLIPIIIIALLQIRVFYGEVFTHDKYVPDDVDISKRVSKYQEQIYLDDDYLPIAVYYSDRNIKRLVDQTDDYKTLVKLYQNEKKPFIVITRSWAVENLKVENIPYRLLEKNNSFSILTNR